MNKINEQGQIVDDNGVPIKDHKGEIIVVPLEYRYNYQEYLKKDQSIGRIKVELALQGLQLSTEGKLKSEV